MDYKPFHDFRILSADFCHYDWQFQYLVSEFYGSTKKLTIAEKSLLYNQLQTFPLSSLLQKGFDVTAIRDWLAEINASFTDLPLHVLSEIQKHCVFILYYDWEYYLKTVRSTGFYARSINKVAKWGD